MLEHELAGGEAEPGGEDAVVGAGRPAALKVAEDDAAGLDPGLLLDRLGDRRRAMPPRRRLPKGSVASSRVSGPSLGELGPFRDDHDAVILAGSPPPC